MKYGHFYMHENALDICIEITGEFGDGYYYRFWNLGCMGRPFLVELPSHKLGKASAAHYTELTHAQLYSKREVAGVPK